jgi:hypothetical protein
LKVENPGIFEVFMRIEKEETPQAARFIYRGQDRGQRTEDIESQSRTFWRGQKDRTSRSSAGILERPERQNIMQFSKYFERARETEHQTFYDLF